MATFKPGDTATVRTSGEVVFILAIKPSAKPLTGDLGVEEAYFETYAIVRRPIATQDGIQHVKTTLYVEELESQEDRLRKDYESFKDLYASGQTNVTMPISGASN